MDASDEELVRRCAAELPYVTAAFEMLVRRHEPAVFRTCLRYLRNEQEAEEAGQDAFLRAFHALPRFEGCSAFRTWLLRIVTNVCATRYAKLLRERDRRAAYERAVGDEAAVAKPLPPEPDDIAGPLGDALETLSDDDRQILILRHITELSFEEIGEVLELKLSAAKMRLYRAEQRLREAYDVVADGGEKNSAGL